MNLPFVSVHCAAIEGLGPIAKEVAANSPKTATPPVKSRGSVDIGKRHRQITLVNGMATSQGPACQSEGGLGLLTWIFVH